MSAWAAQRLRYFAEVNPPIKPALLDTPEASVTFLPMEAIGEDGSIDLSRTRCVEDVRNGYSYFEDGDILFAKVTPCFENGKGAILAGLESGVGFGTTELTVLRPSARVEPRFLDYLVRSDLFRQPGVAAMTGAGGLKRVPDEFTKNFQFRAPSLPEQERIANFLDEKTVRIDALIVEKERLVTLCKELRESTVTWAVTGGLRIQSTALRLSDGAANECPAGWKRGRLTNFIGPVVDYRGRTPEKVDDGFLLITARNIRNGIIDYGASAEFTTAEGYEETIKRGRPMIGDVLFTMEAPLGQTANVDREDIALAQRIVKFRGEPNSLDNYYLKYWLMGDVVQSELKTLATGSTAEGLKASKLGQIPLFVPPLKEQAAIVEYLDDRLQQLESVAESVNKHVSLLKEYRSSLITATVTGQLSP